MGANRWALLGRLRTAVKKIRLLLSFRVNRWRVASMIGNVSGKRAFSFNDRPGLRACTDGGLDLDYSPSSSRGGGLSRTSSCPSGSDDDIDKRADIFIANFYRQLQIERQVSLELRYCRGNSFESMSPP